MTKDELKELSIEDLEKLNNEADEVIQTQRAQKKTITEVIDEKVAQAAARKHVEGLDEQGREALTQVLKATGIPSEEAVNGG